jgi:hypothetical protein
MTDDLRYTIASSEAADGNMSVRWEKEKGSATRNMAMFLERHGFVLDNTIVISIPKENGTLIARVSDTIDWPPDDAQGRYIVDADGLIIEKPKESMAVVLMTGDCVPMVFTDVTRPVYGIAHGSWESTDKQIAAVMVQHMCKLGSKLKNIKVHLGPNIKAPSYLFDPRHPEQRHLRPEWRMFMYKREDGMVEVDIVAYCVAQLEAVGIPPKNITVSPIDTYIDDRYAGMSHRYAADNNEDEGRFVTIVGLK